MEVYRIVSAKWAHEFSASGRTARWNSRGRFMIYTAGRRALACLESLVHRRGLGSDECFKIMVIVLSERIAMEEILRKDLPASWASFEGYDLCRALGDRWLSGGGTAVLKVPSAIIPEEFNYLLNPAHADFAGITIHSADHFGFDERLLEKR